MPNPDLILAWLMMPSQFMAAWVDAGFRIASGEFEPEPETETALR